MPVCLSDNFCTRRGSRVVQSSNFGFRDSYSCVTLITIVTSEDDGLQVEDRKIEEAASICPSFLFRQHQIAKRHEDGKDAVQSNCIQPQIPGAYM